MRGDLSWTFYGILYSGVFFAFGLRIEKSKGAVGRAAGLKAIAIFAICLDVVRAFYYLQWVAIPFVLGALVAEVVIMVSARNAQRPPDSNISGGGC